MLRICSTHYSFVFRASFIALSMFCYCLPVVCNGSFTKEKKIEFCEDDKNTTTRCLSLSKINYPLFIYVSPQLCRIVMFLLLFTNSVMQAFCKKKKKKVLQTQEKNRTTHYPSLSTVFHEINVIILLRRIFFVFVQKPPCWAKCCIECTIGNLLARYTLFTNNDE